MEPPDLILGEFLTRLAVDDDLRARFEARPRATLDGFTPRLKDDVKEAILDRQHATLLHLFNIANQSSGPGGAPANDR
jgi:hypothetical protein